MLRSDQAAGASAGDAGPSATRNRADCGISFLRRDGAGAGCPLVLLHGIGSNAGSFAPLMDALGDARTTVAWDAPGYGGSDPLRVDWPSATDYAGALGKLLQELDLRRVVVVGHSLGALIAARFATLHSEHTAGLIALSPAAGYGALPQTQLPHAAAGRLEALTRLGAAAFAAQRAPRLVAEPALNPDVVRAVEQAMAMINLRGYTQATRMLSCARIYDDLAALTRPALVLCGAGDTITPPDQASRIARTIPEPLRWRGGLLIFKATAHALPQERPDCLATTIDAFAAYAES
jgi:pimeloyl-ACP methyl ester carboxylesterase